MQIPVAEHDPSAVGALPPREDREQCCLARSAGADQANEFSRQNSEGDSIEDSESSPATRIIDNPSEFFAGYREPLPFARRHESSAVVVELHGSDGESGTG